MSKFTEGFDKIEASESLKEKTRERIRAAETAENNAGREADSVAPVNAGRGFTPAEPATANVRQGLALAAADSAEDNSSYEFYVQERSVVPPPSVDARKIAAKRKRRSFWIPASIVAGFWALLVLIPVFASILADPHADNPAYDFSEARQVKSVSELKTLLAVQEYQPNQRSPLFGGLLWGCSAAVTPQSERSEEAPWFDSSKGGSFAPGDSAPPPSPDSPANALTPGSSSGGSYSQTNVQVAGMDEGDIIKTDGKYIYRLSPGGLTIAQAKAGQLTPVCQKTFENFSPIEMYIRENRLIVIGGGYQNNPSFNQNQLRNGGFQRANAYHKKVEIRVYDLTDTANPVLERFFEVDGDYHTSRIHEESGTLYFVTNYYNYSYDYYDSEAAAREAAGKNNDAEYAKRPHYRKGEKEKPAPMPVEDIYYFKHNPSKSYMVLGKVDLDDPASETEVKSYLSSAGIIYVSGENLYTSSEQWFYSTTGARNEQRSYIAKFSLADLEFKGSASLRGSPKNRYFLDEFRLCGACGEFTNQAECADCQAETDVYLRVVASYRDAQTASAVYAIDSGMKVTDKIMSIAPGEKIDSASFAGIKGVISTSPIPVPMDPLFIIDFSDPQKLTISDGLKEPGINEYMKYVSGYDADGKWFSTGYTLGFGTDANGGQVLGTKVQLYDMNGAMPESKAKFTIIRPKADGTGHDMNALGDQSYAEILSNPKALLYMYDNETKKGIVGFAVEYAGYSRPSWDYTVYVQGLYLFEFDIARETLELRGILSNFDLREDVYKQSSGGGWNWQTARDEQYGKYVSRGIVIDGYIYTVSDNVIAAYDLATLTQTSVLSSVPPAASAGLQFTLINGGTAYSVSRGSLTAANVIIPAAYNGLPVTEIAAGGFSNHSVMTSIVIPDSVESIGDYAFGDCWALTTITIPNGVTNIGDSVFSGCRALTTLTIPNSVVHIADSAFQGCYSLVILAEAESEPAEWSANWNSHCPVYWGINNSNFVKMNEALYLLENDDAVLIRYFGNQTAFVIPQSVIINAVSRPVTRIDHLAFYDNVLLENVTISDGITTIGDYAFRYCQNLKEIVIPASVVDIGKYAFYACSKLTSITIPNSATNIDRWAFDGCFFLTIYVESFSTISDISKGFLDSNRPVVWGCVLAEDGNGVYVESWTKAAADSISYPNASNGITAPYREGYAFGGWSAKEGGAAAAYTAAQLGTQYSSVPVGATLYAIWMKV